MILAYLHTAERVYCWTCLSEFTIDSTRILPCLIVDADASDCSGRVVQYEKTDEEYRSAYLWLQGLGNPEPFKGANLTQSQSAALRAADGEEGVKKRRKT
jgi:hypothetical protein